MIGKEMKEDGYPYRFGTVTDNKTHFCFIESGDTVSDLITSFLKLILGDTYVSPKYYNLYIIFKAVKVPQQTVVINSFKTKKDINIIFLIRRALKNDTIVPSKNIVEKTFNKLLVSN